LSTVIRETFVGIACAAAVLVWTASESPVGAQQGPPPPRDELSDPLQRDAQAAGVDDKSMKTFVRSRCLVRALTDNTRGMLTAHPECQAPN